MKILFLSYYYFRISRSSRKFPCTSIKSRNSYHLTTYLCHSNKIIRCKRQFFLRNPQSFKCTSKRSFSLTSVLTFSKLCSSFRFSPDRFILIHRTIAIGERIAREEEWKIWFSQCLLLTLEVVEMGRMQGKRPGRGRPRNPFFWNLRRCRLCEIISPQQSGVASIGQSIGSLASGLLAPAFFFRCS